MATLERHPDELWTSYFVRRLRAEGFKPTEDDFDVTDLYEADPDGNHTLRLTIGLQQGKLGLLRHLADEGLEKCLRESRTYGDVQERILQEGWMEVVYVEREEYKNPLDFLFYRDGKVKISWVFRESFQDIPLLEKYQQDTVWKAEECIDDIIHYIRSVGYQEELVGEESDSQDTAPRMETKRSSSATLDVLSEGEHLSRLYVEAINRDAHNQRFFEYRDKRIFYVLVDSSDIGGNVGKPFHNLYFVARDLVPEEWQQKIVAFHESQCLHFGSHEAAKAKEPRLARFLGKEQEYLVWREQIDNGKLGCQGREEE